MAAVHRLYSRAFYTLAPGWGDWVTTPHVIDDE